MIPYRFSPGCLDKDMADCSASKTDYRISLKETKPSHCEHTRNMDITCPPPYFKVAQHQLFNHCQDITMATVQHKLFNHCPGITMATVQPRHRSREGRLDSPCTDSDSELSFDYQMEYKGFRTQEQRNKAAYFRIAQNRFYSFNGNKNNVSGVVSVINVSRPVALRSRHLIASVYSRTSPANLNQ